MICLKQKLKHYILDAVIAVFELQEAMLNYICNTDSNLLRVICCGQKKGKSQTYSEKKLTGPLK